ncbi:uncharacterized protein LOC118479152 [Aplysia californica]|uniref:Uncharacterized protein LOC118479152 n=1 Tax=Aplysia californica TaxID=6500 RepID=A0ABM1W4S3_APLCA|nr:uncharacterized protein LOC118479152 [Aplysia californica]
MSEPRSLSLLGMNAETMRSTGLNRITSVFVPFTTRALLSGPPLRASSMYTACGPIDDDLWEAGQETPATSQVFRYQSVVGHHAKPVCSELYIHRRDHRNGKKQVVPTMLYNLEANRPPVPEHQLLEDDFRAFRSVAHNRQTVLQSRMTPDLQVEKFLQDNHLACTILGTTPNSSELLQLAKLVRSPGCRGDQMVTYRNSVADPLGYVYRRHARHAGKQEQQGPRVAEKGVMATDAQRVLPTVQIDESFQNMHVPLCARNPNAEEREIHRFCADAILVSDFPERMYVHNEPDAVPSHLTQEDFSKPLIERV